MTSISGKHVEDGTRCPAFHRFIESRVLHYIGLALALPFRITPVRALTGANLPAARLEPHEDLRSAAPLSSNQGTTL